MILKMAKFAAIGTAGVLVVAGVLFGTEAGSYISSSFRSVQAAAKDQVPVEFELKRARDLLDQIIPEMQANLRLIAQEEVEVASLRADIERSDSALLAERVRVTKMRDMLGTGESTFRLASHDYSREQIREELARQFDRVKEAEQSLAGKRKLLDTRAKSVTSAMACLDRTRSQKVRLEDQIASLESQHRLVKAASAGSALALDSSKLAQTEKLISDVRKRLDVAERVLAHEARFTQPIPIDSINEGDLLNQVNEYLGEGPTQSVRPTSADGTAAPAQPEPNGVVSMAR